MNTAPLPTTLAELPGFAAERYADQEALSDQQGRLTFGELREEINLCARAAVACGIAHGDRVAVWAANSREWITAVLGAVSVGAVVVPLNTRYKGAEAADIIRRSGASYLLTERGFLGIDYPAMLGELTGSLRATVLLRGTAGQGELDFAQYLAAGKTVGEPERARRAGAVRADDLCDIIFTSGTTGRPKGVMVTHGQTIRVYREWSRNARLRPGDRYLLMNPFFHTFGYKAGILVCLLNGAVMVPEAVYDPARVLALIAQERISVLMGPPTLFHTLLRHPGRGDRDLTSLRLAGLGAATIAPELIEEIRAELGIAYVFNAYGLTESCGVATMCPPDERAELIARSAGVALPGTEVRTARADGSEAPPGEPGEVQVRGYNVMVGYLDDPAATAEALADGGWLRTGDIGVRDERGYLTVTDRLKDMYVVGGFNAYPAEVEHTLIAHEGIADVAVVGAPDARLGEVGVAYYVPAAGRGAGPEELTAWTRERLANFKVPRRFVAVDTLPRNAGGKLLKAELRRRAREEADRRAGEAGERT
ncbi:FadD3 family acyl-CoA ligase [Streptomyces sp. NBC_01267]|uniref:FadD3 family acyl-CoA ligase n=1 Tax=unclassified Streptomyces TaxID=2593676 RepID=UPI0020249E0E|nr:MULTISPECIES: FadD3 family acyl-CoA ligase [unclassified Streptomyces]MCX4552917.1 FadD3 family acyl-CoA ligase [Streptomyces sp. NBC_01500]